MGSHRKHKKSHRKHKKSKKHYGSGRMMEDFSRFMKPKKRKSRKGRRKLKKQLGGRAKPAPANVGGDGVPQSAPMVRPIDTKTTVVPEELELDWVPPVQSDIVSKRTHPVNPVQGNTTDMDAYEFEIISGTKWIGLNNLETDLHVKYVTLDGQDLDAAAIVDQAEENNPGTGYRLSIPETNTFHSIWSMVEITLNNTVLKIPLYHYHIFAFIRTFMSTGQKDFDMSFYEKMYEHDLNRAQQIAAGQNHETAYPGKVKRIRFLSAASGVVHMRATFYHPLLEQMKLLPPTNMLRLAIKKVDNRAAMNGPVHTRPMITKIKMDVEKNKLTPEAEARLRKYRIIRYPVIMYHEFTRILNRGIREYEDYNMYVGAKLPTHMFAVILRNEAFSGSYEHSCLNFESLHLDKFSLKIDGDDFPSPHGYVDMNMGAEITLTSRKNMKAYHAFMNAVQKMHPYIDFRLTYEEWATKGNTIFFFDLTNSQKFSGLDPSVTDESKSGIPLGVNLKFNEDLEHTYTLLMFAGFDETVKLDQVGHTCTYSWKNQ